MLPGSIASRVLLITMALVGDTLLRASAGDLIQWTDEKGNLYFSDSLENVPSRYRDHIKMEKLKEKEGSEKPRPNHNPIKTEEGRVAGPASESPKPTLNSYEIPFEAYEGTAQRVIVSVKFNDSVTARMLLDTGAPRLMLSHKLANRLGLLSGNEGKVLIQTGGIGGSVPAIRTFIDKVQIGEAQDDFIPATITSFKSSAYEGLIGMDFMSKYSFKIDSAKQVVIFEEIEPNSNWPGGRTERWWRDCYRELREIRTAWKRFVPQEYRQAQYPDDLGRIAIQQVIEVEKLISKLDRYASQHSVPQSWR